MTMTMISPSIGRKVWYYPSRADTNRGLSSIDPAQPYYATVIYVWSGRMVNLVVTDHFGNAACMTSVPLLQGDDCPPLVGGYATWMPYQVGQAKRHSEEKAA